MLVTASDNTPTKRIVAVLGTVFAKRTMWLSDRPDKCVESLKEEARKIGANAIINFRYQPAGLLGVYGTCMGLAVRVQDE